MSLPEMPCQELVEVITDYLEGTLPEPDRARFEEHLAVCRGCRTYLAQMRQTIAATGSLSEDTLTPAERERLGVLFRGWRSA
jgi:anti-sigma factor RsiW